MHILVSYLKNGSEELQLNVVMFEKGFNGGVMEMEIWKKVSDVYFKSATAWIKYLRRQL